MVHTVLAVRFDVSINISLQVISLLFAALTSERDTSSTRTQTEMKVSVWFFFLFCVFWSLSICLSTCLPASLSLCLSVCLSLSVSVSVCLSVCLSVSLSLSVSVCLSVSLSLSKDWNQNNYIKIRVIFWLSFALVYETLNCSQAFFFFLMFVRNHMKIVQIFIK